MDVTIRMDRTTHERVCEAAKAAGCSTTRLMRDAIETRLEEDPGGKSEEITPKNPGKVQELAVTRNDAGGKRWSQLWRRFICGNGWWADAQKFPHGFALIQSVRVAPVGEAGAEWKSLVTPPPHDQEIEREMVRCRERWQAKQQRWVRVLSAGERRPARNEYMREYDITVETNRVLDTREIQAMLDSVFQPDQLSPDAGEGDL